jgi:bifunctional non-homologous end joining protein LigD
MDVPRAAASTTTGGREAPVVAGIRLSHPARLIYPELGLSKEDLARYYERIGGWILPHVRSRPLTLVHCPQGLSGPCRYLRHAKAWGPSALRRVRIQEKNKIGEYLVADSVSAVVALAQMGVVEIHTWNSTDADVERPNRLVWDLDPGPLVAWSQVLTAARLVRDVLSTLGLQSWVKTTGGRGLHVVAPLRPAMDWAGCLAFSSDVSLAIVQTNPALYTTAFARRGRERKILIDYLRNNRTNTSICAYSPRARAGAPVSMPLPWNDVGDEPDRWTLPVAARRLGRSRRDPWAEYWTCAQTISDAARRAVRRL